MELINRRQARLWLQWVADIQEATGKIETEHGSENWLHAKNANDTAKYLLRSMNEVFVADVQVDRVVS